MLECVMCGQLIDLAVLHVDVNMFSYSAVAAALWHTFDTELLECQCVMCGQLIDLAVLHVDVNMFSYSAVAAAAVAHTFDTELALRVSECQVSHVLLSLSLSLCMLECVMCGQLIDLAVLHVDVNMFSYSAVAAAAVAYTFDTELALRVSGKSCSTLSLSLCMLECVMCGLLIDLAVLHVDVNMFSYSAVAAAAVAHTFDTELALRVSGYSWESLEPCYRWLAPFVSVVREDGAVCVVRGGDGEFVQRSSGLHHICPDLNADESHRIQSHNVTLDMFETILAIIPRPTLDLVDTLISRNNVMILPQTKTLQISSKHIVIRT
ncbi:hypothetical protein NE865_15964 [Phthorimaea operculella]|nr:hypothetical protein NE865_15964 [Phthorimaea operculella]